MISDNSLECLIGMKADLAVVMERQNNLKESVERLDNKIDNKIDNIELKIREIEKKMKPIGLKEFLMNNWKRVLVFNFVIIVVTASCLEYYYHGNNLKNHDPIAIRVLKNLH